MNSSESKKGLDFLGVPVRTAHKQKHYCGFCPDLLIDVVKLPRLIKEKNVLKSETTAVLVGGETVGL